MVLLLELAQCPLTSKVTGTGGSVNHRIEWSPAWYTVCSQLFLLIRTPLNVINSTNMHLKLLEWLDTQHASPQWAQKKGADGWNQSTYHKALILIFTSYFYKLNAKETLDALWHIPSRHFCGLRFGRHDKTRHRPDSTPSFQTEFNLAIEQRGSQYTGSQSQPLSIADQPIVNGTRSINGTNQSYPVTDDACDQSRRCRGSERKGSVVVERGWSGDGGGRGWTETGAESESLEKSPSRWYTDQFSIVLKSAQEEDCSMLQFYLWIFVVWDWFMWNHMLHQVAPEDSKSPATTTTSHAEPSQTTTATAKPFGSGVTTTSFAALAKSSTDSASASASKPSPFATLATGGGFGGGIHKGGFGALASANSASSAAQNGKSIWATATEETETSAPDTGKSIFAQDPVDKLGASSEVPSTPPPQKTGEEDEMTLFRSRVSCQKLDREKQEWKQRGKGPIHVNVHPKLEQARIGIWFSSDRDHSSSSFVNV